MTNKNNQEKKREGHVFTRRICHWLYCKNCGLVWLKNEATAKRIREDRCDG